MEPFLQCITWRLCTALHVSGVLTPIIRNPTTAVAAPGFTFVSWCYHHDTKVKPEVATAVVGLLMMGVRTSETCWTVNKRQDNKLEKLLHLVGDLFEACLCSVKSVYPYGLHLSDYFVIFILSDNSRPAQPLHRSACGQSADWTVIIR
jgi:uncharacterized protein YqgC (DUF456 family)